jgi:hypothetical protein
MFKTDISSVSLAFPKQIQDTTTIKYTAYTCRQMHHFQYIFVMYLALYISYAYWHPQNLLVNISNWVTYACIHIYICMYLSYQK